MKKLILLFLLGVAISAQAEPFTYESQAELSSTLDANGDGLTDMIIVDKDGGVRQLAMQQSDGTFLWLDPVSVGLDEVTALSVGIFTGGSAAQGFVVTSPKWNRAQVWPAGAVTPSSAQPWGIGPNFVVALDFSGTSFSSTDGIDDVVLATRFDDPPGSGSLSGNAWDGLAAAVPSFKITLDAPLSHGNRARFAGSEKWFLAAMQAAGNGAQFDRALQGPISLSPAVTGLPANTTWTFGEFDDTGLSTFLFSEPGSSIITSQPVTSDGVPPYRSFGFGTLASCDLGKAVANVIVVPKTSGSQLLVLFTDGTAGIYDFDGANVPVPREALTAPPGMQFSLAGALGNGHFLLMHGATGGAGRSTGWQRWNFNGSTHTLAASGALPSSVRPSRHANVLIYAADPNANPDAALLNLLQAGEWSTGAAYQGGALTVDAQHTVSSALGLGVTATLNLGSGFASDFAAVNQSTSDTSIAVFTPAIGLPVDEVTFIPPAGTYHLASGGTLTVRISSTSAAPVYYRTDSAQPWTLYDNTAPPTISATATFHAFAGDNGQISPSGATPIRRAVYVIAAAPAVTPPGVTDANHNGMSDAWESALGISDPYGDGDGDGFSNLDEYLAGTDPFNPNSKPDASDLAGVQLVIRPPGSSAPPATRVDLAWPSGLLGVGVESTIELTNPASWIPLSIAPEFTGPERVYHHPEEAGVTIRFFRLHRQP